MNVCHRTEVTPEGGQADCSWQCSQLPVDGSQMLLSLVEILGLFLGGIYITGFAKS